MKYQNILIPILLLLSSELFGQSTNEFTNQLEAYYKFISSPIHLPKKPVDVIIDFSKCKDFLQYDYNASNFYLDQNNTAWAGNWFAWEDGGIATRWHTISSKKYANKDELNLEFWNKVKNMTKEEIAELSPIEKYDIYSCEQSYEFFWASNQELIARGPYKLPAKDANGNDIPCGYCGFCNGARVSGALMPEPVKEIIVKAKHHPEMNITFYPADLKALLASSFYYLDPDNILNIGINYDNKKSLEENKQFDPNPAVLDIILREYLSANKIPLFIDVQYNSEIWNETILGFDRAVKSTKIVNKGKYSNPNIVKEILIECTLFCQDEVSIKNINQKTTSIIANKSVVVNNGWVKQRKYRYNLLLDNKGTILDGIWVGSYLNISKAGEPVKMAWTSLPIDFIWLAKGEGADSKHIYNSNDSNTANYTGNRNIAFKDLSELVKLSSDYK